MNQVRTKHIQQMLQEALDLAKKVDTSGHDGSVWVANHVPKEITVTVALERAVNLAKHAAEELEDERQRTLGWR